MSKKGGVANPYSKRAKQSTSEEEAKSNTTSIIQEIHNENHVGRRTSSGPAASSCNSYSGSQLDSNATFSQAFVQDSGTNHQQASTNSLEKSLSNAQSNPHNHQSAVVHSAIDQTALIQPHVLLVSTRQRGNSVLRLIRNVPFTYAKIVPDYIFGPNRCALFLSFKYHNLNPNYIHKRIAELKNNFDLRVLLCLVDVDDNAAILLHLNKTCVVHNLSLTLAWSEQEAARYLETFKAFEGKDASSIQKKKDITYSEQVTDVLGCVRSVNKTDASQLLSQFGNFKSLATTSIEELQSCPGIGEKKVRRLYDAFTKPFSTSLAKKRKEEKERLESIEKDIANVEEYRVEEGNDGEHLSQKDEGSSNKQAK